MNVSALKIEDRQVDDFPENGCNYLEYLSRVGSLDGVVGIATGYGLQFEFR
jgi:methyl coenzyme M reductase subunit C-like uncharacterized protein (methanogenesis marker protein 7)